MSDPRPCQGLGGYSQVSPRNNRFRCQVSAYEICGRQTGTWAVSSPTTSVFPFKYHTNNAPHSFHYHSNNAPHSFQYHSNNASHSFQYHSNNAPHSFQYHSNNAPHSFQYHSNNDPHSFQTHVALTRRTNERSLETFQKAVLFRKPGITDTKYFHFFNL